MAFQNWEQVKVLVRARVGLNAVPSTEEALARTKEARTKEARTKAARTAAKEAKMVEKEARQVATGVGIGHAHPVRPTCLPLRTHASSVGQPSLEQEEQEEDMVDRKSVV